MGRREGLGLSTYGIRQLRLSNQILRLGTNKLMLQRGDTSTIRILVLELGNLISDLLTLFPRRLNRSLHIANMLQDTARVLQILRIEVFLLADLGQHDAQLVGDVRDGIVFGGLAPVGELGGDGTALTAGGFVCTDRIVLALDQSA